MISRSRHRARRRRAVGPPGRRDRVRDRRDRAPPRRCHQDGRRGRCGCSIPSATPSEVARLHRLPAQHGCRPSPAASRRLPGAFPGVGTATEIGASLADTVALVYAQVALVLAVAAAFDHDLDAHDDRAADVRVVLALDAGVATLRQARRRAGRRQAARPARSRAVRGSEPRARRARRQAHGARRARTLLGREIPFGVGVAIGAGANFKVDAPHGPHGAALLRLHREQRRTARA